MKKKTLKRQLAEAYDKLEAARIASEDLGLSVRYHKEAERRLTAEVEQMKTHWRPVPITHEWTPRNPQCALCDEPRDAARHQACEIDRERAIDAVTAKLESANGAMRHWKAGELAEQAVDAMLALSENVTPGS